MKNDIIQIQDTAVTITQNNGNDYICITDMAKAKEGDSRAADVIKNWIRTRTTLEFIGTWEIMNNPNFKVVEFDHFKTQAGSAKQWRDANPAIAKNKNIRDFATLNQLAVLSNLETHNAELIKQGIDKKERYNQLLNIANYQLGVLSKADVLKAITNRK